MFLTISRVVFLLLCLGNASKGCQVRQPTPEECEGIRLEKRPVVSSTVYTPVLSHADRRPSPVLTESRPTLGYTERRPSTVLIDSRPVYSQTERRPSIYLTDSRPTTTYSENRPTSFDKYSRPVYSEADRRPSPVWTESRPTSIYSERRPINFYTDIRPVYSEDESDSDETVLTDSRPVYSQTARRPVTESRPSFTHSESRPTPFMTHSRPVYSEAERRPTPVLTESRPVYSPTSKRPTPSITELRQMLHNEKRPTSSYFGKRPGGSGRPVPPHSGKRPIPFHRERKPQISIEAHRETINSLIQKYETNANISKVIQKEHKLMMMNWNDEYQVRRLDVSVRSRLEMEKHEEHNFRGTGNKKWAECVFAHRKDIRRSNQLYRDDEMQCLRASSSKDNEEKDNVEQLDKEISQWRKGYRYLVNLCEVENPMNETNARECLVQYMQSDSYDEVIDRLLRLKNSAMIVLLSHYDSSIFLLEECLKTQLSKFLERVRALMEMLTRCYNVTS
ncbi:uncharacterized protein LOC142976591 [Anticarsia gemmatalis]|uniref:uncharacterized protein LOC142976591 n=1 Tax=Anticarsia gemmatalis TaxID=129554 RepID=UPI003F75BF1A